MITSLIMNKIKELYIKYEEIINYLIVGGLTTIVSLGTYYACVLLFLDPLNPAQLQLANVISWVAAVLFAYVTNRKYVFKSKNKGIFVEMLKFFTSRVGTLLMDMTIMFIGVTVLHYNDKIMKLLVQVIVTVFNYIFSKWLVFKNNHKSKAD